MNIQLINPIFHDKQSVFTDVKYPPVGLLQVAAELQRKYNKRSNRKDTKVIISDGQLITKEKVINTFKKLSPEIVGFNVIIGQPLKDSHELSRVIHSLSPKTRIIWGGAIARINPYFAPDYVEIDSNYYDSVPAWNLLEHPEEYEHALFTSRGCVFSCQFCFHRVDDKLRFESFDRVIHQMHYLSRNYGWKDFKMMDDNFFTSVPRAIKIMDEMKKHGYRIKQAHSHGNSFTPELIDYLDKDFIGAIGISIEHGNQTVVDSLGKNLNLDKTLKKIEKFGEKGIKTIHNFIFGLPFKQNDQLNFALMRRIKTLNPLARGVGFVYAPMPETPLTNQIEAKYGAYPRTYKFWSDFDMAVINKKYNKWLTPEQIKEAQRMADEFNKEFNS